MKRSDEQRPGGARAPSRQPGPARPATRAEPGDPPAPAEDAVRSPTAVGKPPHAPGQPMQTDAGVGLPLPHERDESVDSTDGDPPDPLMERARQDIESGQVDTDLRTTPGLDATRRDEILRRGRGRG